LFLYQFLYNFATEAGVPSVMTAEIIPCEPDADNTDEGSFTPCLKSVFLSLTGIGPTMVEPIFYLKNMSEKLKTILSIAGSDSCAGAGIQADIKAASLCGIYAMTAITAVTAQSTGAIHGIMTVPSRFLEMQLEAVVDDQQPDAVKIGMIGSLENGKTIVKFLKEHLPHTPVVVDPVATATSGNDLLDKNGDICGFYINELLPAATVVTPNVKEAEMILGSPLDIADPAQQTETASMILKKLRCKAIVLKGGHTQGPTACDVLVETAPDGSLSYSHNESPRIVCHNLHGTGCTFSTLIACGLASGQSIHDAFRFASDKTHDIIRKSVCHEFGIHQNGPLNIFDFKTLQASR